MSWLNKWLLLLPLFAHGIENNGVVDINAMISNHYFLKIISA